MIHPGDLKLSIKTLSRVKGPLLVSRGFCFLEMLIFSSSCFPSTPNSRVLSWGGSGDVSLFWAFSPQGMPGAISRNGFVCFYEVNANYGLTSAVAFSRSLELKLCPSVGICFHCFSSRLLSLPLILKHRLWISRRAFLYLFQFLVILWISYFPFYVFKIHSIILVRPNKNWKDFLKLLVLFQAMTWNCWGKQMVPFSEWSFLH